MNPVEEQPLTPDPAPKALRPTEAASTDIEDAGRTDLERMILERLDDEKALDIVFINLRNRSAFADSLIIASGRSSRHVGAIADHLLRALKDAGQGKARIEGLPSCDWVLIDVGDIVVHLFRPEVRAYYNIEKIWSADSGHLGPIAH